MTRHNPAFYTLVHKATGNVYVGSCSSVNDRLAHHRWALKKGTHTNPNLQKLFDESNSVNFKEVFDVIVQKTPDKETALVLEQAKLDELQGTGRLLNVATDASNPGKGITVSPEGRARISAAKKGVPISDYQRQRLSETHTGKTLTEEHRHAISKRHKGVPKTPEHVAKVATAHHKKVVADGVTYSSVKEFAQANGYSMATASRKAKMLREIQ